MRRLWRVVADAPFLTTSGTLWIDWIVNEEQQPEPEPDADADDRMTNGRIWGNRLSGQGEGTGTGLAVEGRDWDGGWPRGLSQRLDARTTKTGLTTFSLEIYVVARMRAFGSIGLQGAAAQCLLNQSEKSSICPRAQLTLNCSSAAVSVVHYLQTSEPGECG